MYWIPIIFIFCELIYISNLDSITRYSNCNILLNKFKDRNLQTYIKNEFKSISIVFIFIGIYLFSEVIYFLVGFFYPLWIMSSIFFIYYIVATIINKIKSQTIEKTVKLANLKNFDSSDIKFQRLLKLNELKGNKTYNYIGYIYSTIRIAIFVAIIVLHYNYKIL